MANFPSSLPAYAGFNPNDTLAADNHASQHNAEQADITAIATKIGTGASTPVTQTVLRGNGTGTSAWSQVSLDTDVAGQLPVGSATAVLQAVYPVGSIYIETTGANPNTTFGFGTWSAYAQGQVMVGNGTSDQAFTAGSTGGQSTHTLSSAEMPTHTHIDPGHTHNYEEASNAGSTATVSGGGGAFYYVNTSTADSSTSVNLDSTGGGGAHNNLQPYVVVYIWRRTA